jgi:hypothetical protein
MEYLYIIFYQMFPSLKLDMRPDKTPFINLYDSVPGV